MKKLFACGCTAGWCNGCPNAYKCWAPEEENKEKENKKEETEEE